MVKLDRYRPLRELSEEARERIFAYTMQRSDEIVRRAMKKPTPEQEAATVAMTGSGVYVYMAPSPIAPFNVAPYTLPLPDCPDPPTPPPASNSIEDATELRALIRLVQVLAPFHVDTRKRILNALASVIELP